MLHKLNLQIHELYFQLLKYDWTVFFCRTKYQKAIHRILKKANYRMRKELDITNIIKIEFDCRPGAIAVSLALREPKYQETAAYCHFGREAVTKNGIKFFEWENAKDLSKYQKMDSAQVEAALKASNYLTKWVD